MQTKPYLEPKTELENQSADDPIQARYENTIDSNVF